MAGQLGKHPHFHGAKQGFRLPEGQTGLQNPIRGGGLLFIGWLVHAELLYFDGSRLRKQVEARAKPKGPRRFRRST